MMYFITKNCACISDSGKDEHRNKDKSKTGLFQFRLLDDDGEVYFYGYSSSKDDEAAFAPLDKYGAAYGCTEIQYKNSVGAIRNALIKNSFTKVFPINEIAKSHS